MQNDPQAAFIESAKKLQSRGLPSPAVVRPTEAPAAEPERRRRSLNTGHRYAQAKCSRRASPRASRAYVPELAACIEDDRNLTDGARRCARKIAELTYRQYREGRSLPVTVTYLARALGRCRRTVQRYLRQLEREGYVSVEVVISQRARMCVGLVVRLLEPLLAAHHRQRWPGTRENPGATPESLNKRFKGSVQAEGYRTSIEQWALRCMDGIFRSYMKTDPLAGLPSITVAQ